MIKRARGFTIVEILIVVVVIGILLTISFMGFGRYQANARDTARASKATVIAEALEKYYDKNGEYPSCPSITGSATTVTTSVLPGIDAGVLVAPQADSGTTNSVLCTDLTNMSQADFFAYVGDSSSTCTTGQACLLYVLKYKQESTDQIVTIESRRKTNIGPTDTPVCSASAIGFTQINASWTAVASASSYDITRSTDSSFSTNVISQNVATASYSATGLSANTTYYFRARANTAVGAGAWCNSVNASTWVIGTPSINIGTVTTNNANISWASTNHAATYTAQQSTDQTNWTSTCLNVATTSCSFTGLSTGLTYYFRAIANNGSYSSAWSTIKSATTSPSPPSNVAATANSSTQITVSWTAAASATSYDVDFSSSSSFSSYSTVNSTTINKVFTGLAPSTTYYFRVRTNINAVSSISSSAVSATTVTPNVVLSGPVECAGTYSQGGNLNGNPAYAFEVRVRAQEVSYDIPSNTSNVTWSIFRRAIKASYSSYDQSKTWGWSVNIGGQGASGSGNSSFWKSNPSVIGETESIGSGTVTITHDVNGNATISYSGSDGPGSSVFGVGSCSGAYGLSTLR